MDRLSQRNC